ncbi:hypothetical protein PInf_026688 [Phytophthora infestans]|nr:hypothetical protein PInf_026688 [Phytophthora infestans]
MTALNQLEKQTREVALELYAQHMYRSHLTESMETIFAKTFSSRRLLSTRWWFGLAGPGCAQLLGEQRRPSDRGQAVAQAGRELLEDFPRTSSVTALFFQERVHGRDDVAPAREQDIVGKDPVVYVRRSEEANLLE